MSLLASIVPTPVIGSQSWLITPNLGLTIWILVVFFVSLFILKKAAFPRIMGALDARKRSIDESIDAAEQARKDADALLAEYRERLAEAREQAEQIILRARSTAEANAREARVEAEARREQLLAQTRRDIEAETRRAIDQIRREVADLTVIATEKVTRKALTQEDQERLIEDALSELDFTVLSNGGR